MALKINLSIKVFEYFLVYYELDFLRMLKFLNPKVIRRIVLSYKYLSDYYD